MTNENDGEAWRHAERQRHRDQIEATLTEIPDRVVGSVVDVESAHWVMQEERDAEIERRLHRELSEIERAITRADRPREWSLENEANERRHGGMADMVGFVDAVRRGFVPERALLHSIAARLEDVLDDTTSLYDRTNRVQPVRFPRARYNLKQIDRLRPRTDGVETGDAFVRAFGLERQRGGRERTVEEHQRLTDVDRRYWSHVRDEPDISDRDVFRLITRLDRSRRVDDLAEESMWKLMPKQADVPDNKVADWIRVAEFALTTVRAMFYDAATPDAPEGELQRSGWELACKARSRAEAREPEVTEKNVTSLLNRWCNWRATQPLPTPAERIIKADAPAVKRTRGPARPVDHDDAPDTS